MEIAGRKNFREPSPASVDPKQMALDALGLWDVGTDRYWLEQHLFVGPRGGADYLRIGIFAGLHGDEVAGIGAAVRFLQELALKPELAAVTRFTYIRCAIRLATKMARVIHEAGATSIANSGAARASVKSNCSSNKSARSVLTA